MSDKGISPVLTEGTRTLALMRAFTETPAGYLVSSGGIALLYFASAKLGLGLALVNPSATAVWPPTGLAFSVILLLGWRMAPALFLGAFAANMTTWGTVATSLVIAAGNVCEGLAGAILVQCLAGGRHVFERVSTIFRFVLFFLEESGIAEALRCYTSGFQERAGIKVVLDAPSGLRRLAPEAERSLFRVVQESLTNIQRHAEASTALITLRIDSSSARLEIRDDGKGVPKDVLASGGGTGIRGLTERMSHLGGRLEVRSRGNGTVITASLPLSAPR